jgi:hypothetical protein
VSSCPPVPPLHGLYNNLDSIQTDIFKNTHRHTHTHTHSHTNGAAATLRRPRARGGRPQDPLETEQLLSINFSWNGVDKDASTILVGTSPEMELALYTMCAPCVRVVCVCVWM